MRHLKLVYQFFVITLVLYLLRPIEATICAIWKGSKSFWSSAKYEFKDRMWTGSGWTAKELYKTAIEYWKEGEK